MAKNPTPATTENPEEYGTAVEVMETASVIPTELYRDLETFEDFLAVAQEAYGDVDDVSETIGDGFAVLEDKSMLIGTPLIFMEWTFRKSDVTSEDYISIRVGARNPDGTMRKYIVNDGGAGLREQLREYQKTTGRTGGLVARRGLRVSEYDYDNGNGKTSRAKTYYIDTSA